MKLYYAPGTCALSVHIVLNWVGAEYELERVQPGSDEYKKINPLGSVPAFIDGGSEVMTQADSLLKYLVDKYPQAELGSHGSSRSEQELGQWLSFLTGDLHPAYFPFFRPARYTVAEDEESLAAVKAAAVARVAFVSGILDEHLAAHEFVACGRRTVADAYAYVMNRWMQLTGLPVEDFPNIQRHIAAMEKDAGVQKALQEQGLKALT